MAASSALAQTEFVAPGLACRSWQLDDGLPDNSVASVLQTRDGFLWLGTYDGFVRFDGRQFQVVRLPGDKSLLAEGILLLCEGQRGQLWGVTDRGRIFAVKNGVTRFVAEDTRFAGRNVSMHEDGNGDLWIGNFTGLLGRVSADGTFSVERNDVAVTVADVSGTVWVLTKQGVLLHKNENGWSRFSAIGFKNEDCRTLAAGVAGEVLVARGNELWNLASERPARIGSGVEFAGISALYASPGGAVWVRQSRHFRRLNVAGKWSTPPMEVDVTWVQSSCTDEEGSLWLGEMGGGLTVLGAAGERRRYRAGEGLNSNRVSSLAIDREGSVWIGFYDGGLQQARRSFFMGVRSGAPLAPTSITEDTAGDIWIAGHGGALARWDGTRCTAAIFEGAALPVQTRVVLCDRRGQLWAGTFSQGLWQRHAEGMRRFLPDDSRLRDPRALFEDSYGRLWIGTDAGAFFLENGELQAVPLRQPDTLRPKVCAFAESREGEVWIATEASGVLYWNGKTVRVPAPLSSLTTATVSLLFTDDQEALWIGTRDAGLLRWKSGVMTSLTPAHGLPDEQLLAMCDDGFGNFWFTSRRGIVRVDKSELLACADGRRERVHCLRFDKSDGLPTAQCMGGLQPSICRARNGRIWVPTSREAVSFDPRRVRTNPKAPLLCISEFFVNGKVVPSSVETLRLKPGAERIELRFGALSFAAPGRVRFAHRLLGLENAWRDDGGNPHINYAHLQPGKYQLEIAAANEHGVWSVPHTAVTFQVLPHLWQTPWFQVTATTVALMASGMVGQRMVARHWKRKLREAEQRHALERERARIARDIHDELGASLTKITLLSQDSGGVRSARQALEEIQSTAREVTRAMDEMVWAVNPQHDTVEGLITYLQRFAQRFLSVTCIRCRFDLPLEADKRQLSGRARHQLFLAYKECLHNVVRHSGASEVNVRVTAEGENLLIEVVDDGHGFAGAEGSAEQADRVSCGHGLLGMAERLAQIGGQCQVLSQSQSGTVVRFAVPLAPGHIATEVRVPVSLS